jgi:phenylpropionate dioxygenase-like ring-hydroxylating dioxygenase large terminal subunit
MNEVTRELLADYWYPVVLSSELRDRPVAVRLLDNHIVIWRSSGGINAFNDLCIHRGTRLSLGWIEHDELVCPYHGWCYGRDGRVTRIPAIPSDRPIPGKARAVTYQCLERYGLVFVCLGNPKLPIYEVPEFGQKGFGVHIIGPAHWKTSAPRSMENFMDEAHLPWVHPGALGNRGAVPIIPQREVKERDGGFFFECDSEVRSRTDPDKVTLNRLTYDIVLPFSLYHENIYPNGDRVIDLFFVSPTAKRESTRYMVVGRNFALDEPPDKLIKFTHQIWEQDRVLVESQRPEELPVDWKAELHVRGPDGPSVIYRKKLIELGVNDVI